MSAKRLMALCHIAGVTSLRATRLALRTPSLRRRFYFPFLLGAAVSCALAIEQKEPIGGLGGDLVRKPSQAALGPDSLPKHGVPEGRVLERSWNESKIYPGTKRTWWIYVPAQYRPGHPACLMVFQDGYAFVSRTSGSFRAPNVLDNLIADGTMPITIALFINPGNRPPTAEQKEQMLARGESIQPPNRSVEYDTLSDRYARFLLEEIIPAVAREYSISDRPEDHAICGNSSGAICAFTVAWQRPNDFRKVVSHIGSFTNIRGGDVYPDLIRSAAGKPIRVLLQDGANDLRNEFGSWPAANLAMASALAAKGYDYKLVWGNGGHELDPAGFIFPDTLRWLWRDAVPKSQ